MSPSAASAPIARLAALVGSPRRAAGGLSTALLAVAAVVLLAVVLPRLFGFGTLAVTSPSMGSATPIGSLVIARWTPAGEIRTGDVIVAQRTEGGRKQAKVLHRVIALRREGGVALARTKGDANAQPDPGEYSLPPRVLRQTYALPYLGYLAGFLRIPLVWLVAVGLPALLLAGLTLRDIWRADGAQTGLEAPIERRERLAAEAEARNSEHAEALRLEQLQLERRRAQFARHTAETEQRIRALEAELERKRSEVRLAELERELDRRVTALRRREIEAAEGARSDAAVRTHLLFVDAAGAYTVVEGAGDPPPAGTSIVLPDVHPGRFVVSRVGMSPVPGDERACAYLLPV